MQSFALAAAAVAVCAGLAELAAGLGHRVGLWSFGAGFQILAGAAAVGGVGAIVSLVAGAWAWRARARPALAAALLGVAAGALALGIPLAEIYQARNVPPIHDISTDTVHPPRFVALLAAREASPNGAAYGGAALAEAQRRGYPDIRPLDYAARPPVAFERCLAAARKLGWKIVAADPRALRIEATATTLLFGFKDDVVVRITPVGPASRIDVRSDSRVGRSDLGTNARRIRAFFRELARQG
ncbi:MAG TPA: DUF1499 domain-containing protein [Burkholderiales bacterium]|nr:DUF1499 domain-containing protein [Burkholderiales bacterium]